MTSLVLELQRDALESSVSVLNLLRKALVVAKKLGIEEFKQWVELELDGYSEEVNIPDYRLLVGELKARNPYHGWIPVILGNAPEIAETISKIYIKQPISEIEELVKSESDVKIMHLPKKIELLLIQMLDLPLQPVLHFSKINLSGILEATRNIVLKWSLKLEDDGIIGEGLTFSAKEKQIAQAAHYTIGTYINMSQTYSSMSDNHSTNIQAGRDASGNLLSSEVTGIVAGGDISGTVNNAINQLQASNNPEVLQLAELLNKLRTVIEAEPALAPDYKEVALEQVAVLAEEGQNSKKESRIKPIKTAIAALRGIVGALPPAAELVKEFNELLPTIAQILNLG
ncbi:MAG: hypothetical protein KME59_20210 [Trichormus sp. ATA11-4-KO1]|nr:hypothetical protein [Trichormus sp. ATA11-4-KO1]